MSHSIELLQKIPLLAPLSAEELSAITQFVHTKRVRPKETIVRQGEPGGELFLIVSGHLKVVSSDAEGRDTALNIMGPGDVFGEVSLLDGGARSATIVALEACELLTLQRERFLQFLESTPKAAIQLLVVLSGRVRRLTERAEDIAFMRVGDRLAKRVVALAEEYGEPLPNGSTRISFRLSQQEIGDLVGATRESANKQIRLWEQRGWVSQEGGHLVIHDLAAMRGLADASF